MVSIMAGPGQNMNMNNVGRAFSAGYHQSCLREELRKELESIAAVVGSELENKAIKEEC